MFMKYILGLFLVLGLVFGYFSVVEATAVPKIVWCHVEPNSNQQTLELPQAALENAGHADAQGNPLHAGDHPGACVEPSVTPSPTPTVEVTPSPTPIVECEEQCEPTPTPEVTPTETPKEEPKGGNPSAPENPACTDPGFAPTIYEVGRVDEDTVYAKWTKVRDDVSNYVVYYGLGEGGLPWNTRVQGEYVELSGPELTGHVFLKVAGDDRNCVGSFSVVTDP